MTMHVRNPDDPRREVFKTLAAAAIDEMVKLTAALEPLPPFDVVRAAEVGMVMLQGRMGGTGPPFNAGEATVTRAVVRLASGEIGYGYRLGHDRTATQKAALIDALWQTPEWRPRIERDVLAPLRAIETERRQSTAETTTASRVEFFTVAREKDGT